jgi:integrase/recombinase XerD
MSKRAYQQKRPDNGYNGRLTPKEAAERVLNIYLTEGYRERTIRDYGYHWNEFTSIVEKTYVDEYTKDDVRAYITSLLRERHLSPVTANIRLSSLKSIFTCLTKEGYIDESPAASIPKLRIDQRRPKILNEKQLRRLFASVNKDSYVGFRDYCMMLVALKCGLRSDEVYRLEKQDIDFVEEIIFLPGVKNKNRKNRPVPLSRKVVEPLRQLINETRRFVETSYVFVNQFGEPTTERTFGRQMRRYGIKSGLKNECQVSPHVLRHTFAVNYLVNGGDIRSLQKILGHSDLSTTEIYLDFTDEMVKKQYRKAENNDNIDL